MPYKPIIVDRNAAKCLKCNDVIESKHRHDFVECSCGNIFVDGGFDYVRTGVRDGWETFEDLSEAHEGPETKWSWEEDENEDSD